MQLLNTFKKIDWLLMVAVFLLIFFGLTSLYSLGLGQTEQDFNLLHKQIFSSVLGIVLMLAVIFFDYRWLRVAAPWLYLASIILLIMVLFLGQNIKGTTGWFVFSGFSIQPVEIVKLSVVIFLAYFFVKYGHQRYQLPLWLKSFLIILPICALVILQPDFGSMAVIFLLWCGYVWLSGVSKKYILIFVLLIISLSFLTWQFILQDYQQDRIITFLNPNLDPLGSGYNVRQSIIAIGSGNMFGRGLSLGTQSQLHFLPVSEADFIFASIAEELGFVGVTVIFILYSILFYRLTKIIKNTKNEFGVFLVFGISLIFLIQVIINIGMTIGLLPITGLPLPFISYGGSFLVISLVLIGVVQSVKVRNM
jgi:rod shape determining protein RodA